MSAQLTEAAPPPPTPPLPPNGTQSSGKNRERRSVRQDPVTIALVALVSLILISVIALPLARIFTTTFSSEGSDAFTRIFTSPVNRTIIKNTVVLGITVATVGTFVGFIFAYVQAKLQFRGKRFMHLLCLLPIVSPPFAVATASITLFGRNGIISNQLLGYQWNIYGLSGLTLVLSLSFFPVAYMNLLGMMQSLNPSLDEAAASLGANKLKIFTSVTLPMLIPGFAASFLLLFVEAIADLANPLVIGGDYTVLASRAYIAITGEYNTAAGSAYSLVLLIPALLVFLVQRYWVSRRSAVSVTGKPSGQPEYLTNLSAKIPLLILTGLMSLFILTIYATVIIGGFVKILGVNNSFSWDNYRYILSGIGSDAMIDTTILALIATPIAGVLGMLIAWLVSRKLRKTSGLMNFAGMLGLAVPGTVLGIGYAITFNSPTTIFGIQIFPAVAGGGAILGGSIAIVMVFIARSIPAGQQNGIAALEQIDNAIDEASTSLGASGLTTFRKVTLPLIKPALLSGLTYAFARSMTTLSPIIFITTPQTKIMTSQILSEVDSGRFGNAFAYCTILIVIVLSVIGLLNLLVRDRKLVTAIPATAA